MLLPLKVNVQSLLCGASKRQDANLVALAEDGEASPGQIEGFHLQFGQFTYADVRIQEKQQQGLVS